MELAAQIGIPITEFWQITPFELSVAAKGYARRHEEEQKFEIAQAFLISRWVWQKRINIKKILSSFEEKAPMTDSEMLAKTIALNAMFGGKVEKK